jgi:peroxiredoxin
LPSTVRAGILWGRLLLKHTTRRILMTVQTGAVAPDFTLASHADQKVSLSGFRGRPVVVTFMPFAFTGG